MTRAIVALRVTTFGEANVPELRHLPTQRVERL